MTHIKTLTMTDLHSYFNASKVNSVQSTVSKLADLCPNLIDFTLLPSQAYQQLYFQNLLEKSGTNESPSVVQRFKLRKMLL